jgi:hypothetical protein
MAIESDGLKKILTTSGFGLSTTFSTSSLSGNELLYTYADVNDTTKPYGNLFKSFNFPITGNESTLFNSDYGLTALGNLNTTKIIVVEIPKGKYGELIDGKTFQLTIPVMLNGVASATTLYGSYFGFSGISANASYLPNLNTKLSEQNTYASQFGLVPSTGNGFNSNITFLFSNDIQRPLNPTTTDSIILSSAITLTTNNSTRLTLTGVTLNTGDIINVKVTKTDNASLPNTIKITIGTQYLTIRTDQTIFERVDGNISSKSPIIWNDVPNLTSEDIQIIITKQNTTNLSWNAWSSPNNKFPNVQISSSGKMYARYRGTSQDKPVGILYNDKGVAVITDPILVSGFRFSAGTSSGYNIIGSGSTYNGDKNFAKIYFTSSTLSQSTFNSITSEFVQNIMCIAGIGEFTTTKNSTFANAYDENASEKPVFITTIGLYNEAKELIGIGKLSEPVKKTEGNIIPFSIKLVI